MMDYNLTPEQQNLQDSAARFCSHEIAPLAKTMDQCPPEKKYALMKNNLKNLGDARLLAAGHEGNTLDMVDVYLAGHEIARACPATYVSSRASAFLCAGAIRLFGSPEQKERYLPGLTGGELAGAFAYSEPQAGSDLDAITASACLERGSWTVSGGKHVVVNAPIADIFIVLAWSDMTADSKSGMSLFIVEKTADGLTIGNTVETMGLRGVSIAPVLMEQCRCTGIIGDIPGNGFAQMRHMQSAGAIGIAALCTGIGTMCMEISTAHARERKAFGRRIGMYQDVGFRLADMFTSNDLGRMLSLRAAWAYNTGQDEAPVLAACAKLYAGEAATKTVNWGMQIFAGHGYVAGTDMERLYRDAKFSEIYEGTSEIQREFIAQHELDRFADF